MPTTKTPKKKAARKPTKRDPVAALLRKIDIRLNVIENRLEQVTKAQEGQWAKNETHWDWLYPKLADVWHANSSAQELEAKKEEQGNIKVGDHVKFKAPKPDWPQGIAVIKSIDKRDWSGRFICTADFDGYKGDWWLDDLRLATPEEIESSAYGERDGLENGDACDTSFDQQRELLGMASDVMRTGMPSNTAQRTWYFIENLGKTHVLHPLSLAPKNSEGSGVRHWLPFPVFKKLLIKTIEKLKAAREEEEAKKKLEFGTKLKLKDGKLALYVKKDNTGHLLIRETGHAVHLDRRQFTVLNN